MKKTALILTIFLALSNFAYAQETGQLQQKASIKITNDVKNTLGTAYAENSIKKTEAYIKANNYAAAKQTLNTVNQWVSDAAEYHTDLFKTLKKVDNADAQANIERDLAIKFATMRDKIWFLQAQIYIHDGQKREAVENLVDVVSSQPTSELGFQAYKLLQNIGFTYGVDSTPIKTDVIQP
ncbi:MAG TPA: hypothetical protein DDW90_02810 [Cyanobacteria bacterium UBA9971]|nr:hypothetical protein [Cyanobacteria bacterium UBA9971]